MREVRGKKRGKLLTMDDGYYYVRTKRSKPTLRCHNSDSERCRGKATIRYGDVIEITMEHDCQPDRDLGLVNELRYTLKNEAGNSTGGDLRNLFNDICRRPEFVRVANRVSWVMMDTSMRNARSDKLPPNPKTMVEYADYLALHDRFSKIENQAFFRTILNVNNSSQIVYIVPGFERLFQESQRLHMDGTFKVTPSNFEGMQLFTILAQKNNHAVLKKVKRQGLWDNYKVANPNPFRKTIKMLMVLPLLPAGDIMDGFEDIEDFATKHGVNHDARPVLDYFRTQWLGRVGPISISVFRQPQRTNNVAESLHSTLSSRFGIHPNIWNFTEKLQLVAQTAILDEDRLANHLRIKRGKRLKWLTQDNKIQTLCNQYENSEISRIQFLKATEYTMSAVNVLCKNGVLEINEDENLIALPGQDFEAVVNPNERNGKIILQTCGAPQARPNEQQNIPNEIANHSNRQPNATNFMKLSGANEVDGSDLDDPDFPDSPDEPGTPEEPERSTPIQEPDGTVKLFTPLSFHDYCRQECL